MLNNLTTIMVAYKSFKLIKKNINFLKKFKIIIFDNSNDIKLAKFLKKYKNILYMKSIKNLGFGKGNNEAFKNVKTKYVFFVNPDTFFKIRDIKILIATFKKYKNVGIVSPAIFKKKNQRINNIKIDYINNFNQKRKFKKNYLNLSSGDICVKNITGCAFLMESLFFKKINGFDERFFLFYEDDDLCRKVILNNKTIIETPNSKVVHLENKSGSYTFLDKFKIIFFHKLSEYIFLKKYNFKSRIVLLLILNFFDYFQRSFFNLIKFNFYNCFKNLVRCLSILYFIFIS